jgi:hypothetical protein
MMLLIVTNANVNWGLIVSKSGAHSALVRVNEELLERKVAAPV